jgi:hypothetical protein
VGGLALHFHVAKVPVSEAFFDYNWVYNHTYQTTNQSNSQSGL